MLRTREIYADTRLSLVAVERVDIRKAKQKAAGQVYGTIKPIAVIVNEADETFAVDMFGRPLDLEVVREQLNDE